MAVNHNAKIVKSDSRCVLPADFIALIWTILMGYPDVMLFHQFCLCNRKDILPVKTHGSYPQSLFPEQVETSVLWHCWLGSRKGIWPVKKLSGGMLAWLCVWVKVLICIWPSWYQPLTISCSIKSRLGLPSWCQLTRDYGEDGFTYTISLLSKFMWKMTVNMEMLVVVLVVKRKKNLH